MGDQRDDDRMTFAPPTAADSLAFAPGPAGGERRMPSIVSGRDADADLVALYDEAADAEGVPVERSAVLRSDTRLDIHAGDLDQQRQVAEGGSEAARLDGAVRERSLAIFEALARA